jgi:hypothetical protein
VGRAERDRRLDLVADAMDLEVEAPWAGIAGERAVVVGLDGGATLGAATLPVPDLLDRAVSSRPGVELCRQSRERRRHVAEQLCVGVVADERVAESPQGAAGRPPRQRDLAEVLRAAHPIHPTTGDDVGGRADDAG